MIELITLILEHGCFAQYGKAVGKAFGNKELAMIVLSQFHSHMLAVGWTTFANIDSHIKDCAFDAAHQFALCEWRALKVQAAHYTIGGFTLIILDEGYRMSEDWGHLLIELSLRDGFEEIASRIFENAGLNYQNAIYGGFDYVHVFFLSISVNPGRINLNLKYSILFKLELIIQIW